MNRDHEAELEHLRLSRERDAFEDALRVLLILGEWWTRGDGLYVAPPELPRYYSDIAAAWEVFTHFGWQGDIAYQGEVWSCTIDADVGPNAPRGQVLEAETAPLAICLAALQANGVEVEWANE